MSLAPLSGLAVPPLRPLRRIAAAALLLVSAMPLTAGEPLSIEEAIRLAVTRNERAQQADQDLAAAEARVSRARSFFFPDVNVVGTYTRRGYERVTTINDEEVTIQSRNGLQSNSSISMPLFDARAFPLYRQARFEREAAYFGSRESKRLVAFEAAGAFVRTLSSEEVRRAAERRRDFAKVSLDDAKARFDAGLVSSNDVTKAELEYASAERNLAATDGIVRTAYLELGNLLNADVTPPLQPPGTLMQDAAKPPASDADAIASAQETRFDLLATRRHVEALREYAKEPSMRWFPVLGAAGQFRTTNEAGLNGHSQDAFGTLTFSWALWDSGERLAEAAERRALVRSAELDLEAGRRSVDRDVRSAAVLMESDQESLRQSAFAVAAARKNADETTELYRQGLASALEVADANVRLFETEVADAQARYQLALALLDLRAALGLGPLGGALAE